MQDSATSETAVKKDIKECEVQEIEMEDKKQTASHQSSEMGIESRCADILKIETSSRKDHQKEDNDLRQSSDYNASKLSDSHFVHVDDTTLVKVQHSEYPQRPNCLPGSSSVERGTSNIKLSIYSPQESPLKSQPTHAHAQLAPTSCAHLAPYLMSQKEVENLHPYHQTDHVEKSPSHQQQHLLQIQGKAKVDCLQDSTKKVSSGTVWPIMQECRSVNKIDSKSVEKMNILLAPGGLKGTQDIPSSQDYSTDRGSCTRFARTSSDLDINPVSTFLADPAQYSHDVSLSDKSHSQGGESNDISTAAQQGNPRHITTSDFTSSLIKLNSLLHQSLNKSSTQTDDHLQPTGAGLGGSLSQTGQPKAGSQLDPPPCTHRSSMSGNNHSILSLKHPRETGSLKKNEGNRKTVNTYNSDLVFSALLSPPPPPPLPLSPRSSKQNNLSRSKGKSHWLLKAEYEKKE